VCLTTRNRVAIFLHEGIRGEHGKTGLTFLRYAEASIVAVIDQQCAGESLQELTGISRTAPIVPSLAEALPYQPEVLLIGIAPSGGALPEAWWQEVTEAVSAGLSVVNGLHKPISPMIESLTGKSLQEGQWIWDIRREPEGLGIAAGKARSLSCQRILTVGTDMSVGKMSTSLELHRAGQRRGINSKFLATGQGGLMITGEGVPLDAVRVDFAAGAVEQAVMRLAGDRSLLLIEGQGSFLHPGSTATLPLMRGSQPTGLILVHRAGQQHIRTFPQVAIPPLPEVIQLYEAVASVGGAFGQVQVKAIALNTLHSEAPQQAIDQVQQQTGLPCTDVVRFGAESLLDAVMSD